jgi:hypothetical protein
MAEALQTEEVTYELSVGREVKMKIPIQNSSQRRHQYSPGRLSLWLRGGDPRLRGSRGKGRCRRLNRAR